MEYFLEVNAKGSPEVSQKPVFGDPKITVPADGGEKRQPAAHKHLICPCGTLDQRSARAGQNTARDAPPPPRPAPRARGTARLRVSLPSPCGCRKSGGRADPDIAALSYCSSIMHDVMILIIIIMDLIPETVSPPSIKNCLGHGVSSYQDRRPGHATCWQNVDLGTLD